LIVLKAAQTIGTPIPNPDTASFSLVISMDDQREEVRVSVDTEGVERLLEFT
jgi:hypothetical protein